MSGLDVVTSLRGYDPREVTRVTGLYTGRESLVQQQFANEVDINTIIRRFGISRVMPSGAAGGVYGDFTGIVDYESAKAAIERAESGFLALPPDVRERFQNDPGVYLEHVDSLTDDELGPEVGVAREGQARDASGRFVAVEPPVVVPGAVPPAQS